MTTSADLRDLTVTALVGQTAAGPNVYSPRDWSTVPSSFPMLLVTTPAERKQSLGSAGGPQFTVTTTVRITARVRSSAVPRDQGALNAELQLEVLKQQIEQAVINAPDLMHRLQQFASVQAHLEVSSESEYHIGELQLDIEMEFYQGPEDFYPVQSVPLATVGITLSEPAGTVQHGATLTLPQ